jgi:hypothetical protein
LPKFHHHFVIKQLECRRKNKIPIEVERERAKMGMQSNSGHQDRESIEILNFVFLRVAEFDFFRWRRAEPYREVPSVKFFLFCFYLAAIGGGGGLEVGAVRAGRE